MAKKLLFCTVLLCLFLALTPTFGQDVEDADIVDEDVFSMGDLDEEEESDIEQAAFKETGDLATSYVFPKSPSTMTFAIGEIIDVVLGVVNTGEVDYNVSAIGGSLLAPHDPSQIVQNFTTFGYNVTIPSGQERSILYRFIPDPYRVDARLYAAVLVVQFTAEAEATERFQSVFFNSTLTLEEKEQGFDYRTIVTFTTIFGLAGGAAYVFMPKTKGRKARPSRKERGEDVSGTTQSRAADGEWLKDVINVNNKSKKRVMKKA